MLKLIALLSLSVISLSAKSDLVVATAQVNIVPPLEINELQSINFGSLGNLDGSCEMLDSGLLNPSGDQSCSDTRTPGIFSITGGSDQQISVLVTAGAPSGGVSFTPKLVGDSSKTLTGGNVQVTVVGTLSMSSASNGSQSLPYTVTVNYQ